MHRSPPTLARLLALACLSPLIAPAADFGTLRVTQLANNNNGLSSPSPGIAIVRGPGSSPGGVVDNGANRGDYNLVFGRPSDPAAGVLVSSIAQLSRDDSATGGPAPGPFFATSSLAIDATGTRYWVALHWAEVEDSVEVNYDVSYAYLPYDEFPGGVVTNSANNGEMSALTGTAGLALGTNFIDLATPGGRYTLNLAPLIANASQTGILLVTGARNEDNYALSRANADGTFDLFCHDSGANGASYENDGVGFSYLAASAVGSHGLTALGRVNGDGSTDVAAGSFTVTKGTTGRWYLEIPGHSQETGTLIVSPEGGGSNNADNIVAAGWDADNHRWIIESRDLTGTAPQIPGLQNMANAAEDAFSFAFSATGAAANQPPAVAAATPADQALKVPVNAPLSLTTTDPDGDNLTVTFHGRRVGSADVADEFSVVALPDTQFYSENVGGNLAAIFSAQTDWIIAEKEARNIGFVLHLGDISQHGDNPATAASEWANASNAMYRLENPATTELQEGIPYVMAVGNHDQTPIGDADGTTTNFNTFFGVHPQTGVNHFAGKSYYGGVSEPAKADNNYCLVSAGGMDFIVISLEYDTTPDAEDLEWADSLLKAYPARRGIVITHHMVNTGNPASFSTMGAALYEALKDNPNLMLMHGGHVHGEGRRSDVYAGRTVHSLLADYQGRDHGGDGWLRVMKFRPQLNRIDVETYSPTLDRFETDDNGRFSLDVDLKSGIGPFTEIGSVTGAPGSAALTWSGLEAGTRYEWYATVSDGTHTISTPVRSFVTDGVLFPPTIEISKPAHGAYFANPANIALEATAADLDGTVAKVAYYSGTTLIGEATTAPYRVTWQNVPTGSYTVIAKATDNEGQVGAAVPISVQVLAEPAAPDVSTVRAGLFNPGWVVAATTATPRNFNQPGTNAGDLELRVNSVKVPFRSGITATANWENAGNGAVSSADNLASAYQDANGNAWVSTLDLTNANAADANPATTEESAGTAVAYLPYANGWTGASVSAAGAVIASHLPAGVTILKVDIGTYTISGLSVTGNLLAFTNGNSGTSADNVLSVRHVGGDWVVDMRDNAGGAQEGDFSFVYLPPSTPHVLSGLISAGGSLTPLNARLSEIGGTAAKKSGYLELKIGDGTLINPSNSALFLTADTTQSLTGAENLVSWSASGDTFRIFSQDLPQISGAFQAADFRFLVVPFATPAAALPELQIQATDANAGEYGGDSSLTFTVTRSNPLTAALPFTYTTGGTATAGSDYTSLSGTATIPASQASVTIPVTVLPDELAEGDETLTLQLTAATGYTLGAPAVANAIIADRPLQAFLHRTGASDAEADDDGDGQSNLLEYYLGSSAGDSTSRSALQAVKGPGDSFSVRFPHARAATDVHLTVEWSLDAATWQPAGGAEEGGPASVLTEEDSATGADPQTLLVTLTFPADAIPSRLFVRLKVAP